MSLGQYIRDLREKRDISLRELAKQIKCSPAFVSDIELGHRYPSGEVLSNIALVLDVKVEELVAHDTRPPLEAIRRLTEKDARYAFAFRKVIDHEISPELLIKLAEKESHPKKTKKQ